LVVGMIIVLIVGGYYWYSKSKSTTAAVQYKTAVAEKGTLIVSVSGSGNIVVDSSSNVDPTITGTVQNLAVSVGDKVTKGQLLFEIDNDDLSTNVTKANASYLQAQQSLRTARANKKDAQKTYDEANSYNKPSASSRLKAAEIGIEAADENLKAAEQSYNSAKSDYNKKEVTAPIAGTVNEINIKNGDDLSKLSSGSSRQVPIIIGDLSTMKAQVEVSEVNIPDVKIGQKATLTFNAIDNFSVVGTVEKMDALGTETSGVVTYNVTVSLDSLDEKIKPEMSVSASIMTATKQDVIVISNTAIKTENNSSYVEVLKNGIVEKKTVQVGLENNSQAEIISGIDVGEEVITQTINGSSTSTSSSSSSSASKTTSSSSKTSSSNRGGSPMGIPGL